MPGFLQPLFRLSYWFHVEAVPFTSPLDRILLLFLLLLVLVGFGVLVFRRFGRVMTVWREWMKPLAECLITAGFVGLMLYGFTWEGVPYLSARIFFLAWFISFGFWGVYLARSARKIPALEAKQKEREAYERWLPKPKK